MVNEKNLSDMNRHNAKRKMRETKVTKMPNPNLPYQDK